MREDPEASKPATLLFRPAVVSLWGLSLPESCERGLSCSLSCSLLGVNDARQEPDLLGDTRSSHLEVFSAPPCSSLSLFFTLGLLASMQAIPS